MARCKEKNRKDACLPLCEKRGGNKDGSRGSDNGQQQGIAGRDSVAVHGDRERDS